MAKQVSTGKAWSERVPFSLGTVGTYPLLFTAGITARDDEGHVVSVGNMRGQIEQCFKNVGDVLNAAGVDYSAVIKWTMYVTDIVAFNSHQDVWQSYFVGRPASTLLEVRRLVDADMLVEIEAVVQLPREARS